MVCLIPLASFSWILAAFSCSQPFGPFAWHLATVNWQKVPAASILLPAASGLAALPADNDNRRDNDNNQDNDNENQLRCRCCCLRLLNRPFLTADGIEELKFSG